MALWYSVIELPKSVIAESTKSRNFVIFTLFTAIFSHTLAILKLCNHEITDFGRDFTENDLRFL